MLHLFNNLWVKGPICSFCWFLHVPPETKKKLREPQASALSLTKQLTIVAASSLIVSCFSKTLQRRVWFYELCRIHINLQTI